MLFTLIILLIWGTYAFAMKKRSQDEFRLSDALLPLVILSVITTISLGTNYMTAAIPSLNDGIGIQNFLAYWVIGEAKWSLILFENYFDYSLAVSISLLIIYSGLRLVKN